MESFCVRRVGIKRAFPRPEIVCPASVRVEEKVFAKRASLVRMYSYRTIRVRYGGRPLRSPERGPKVPGVEGGTRLGRAADGGRDRTLRWALGVALLLGGGARISLALARPLWADEVFTLDLARRPLPDLFAALRLDSGPPLHYLAAKLLLLPFPGPGPADVLVRFLSVAASLLHVPLLVRIARLRGAARAGVVAAALFLVFPLAVSSGAEGRGYALASLLALAAFERLLALDASPRARTAVAAGLLGAAAILTHYLALLPVGGALLAALARPATRRLVLAAAAVAGLAAAAWLPVALNQPHASMAWTEARPLAERALQAAANVGLGLPVEPGAARLAGPPALLLLGVAVASARRARVPAAAPLLAGLLLLVPLLLVSRSALLPDRTALVLLPFVALVLAQAGRGVVAIVSVAASVVVLAVSIPAWVRPTPAEELASTLAPEVRRGARVVAAELWGPELDYRLAREGLAGRVTLFPSDVVRHPGWYADGGSDDRLLREEAAGAVRSVGDGPALFVFNPGTRAGRALLERMGEAGAKRVAAAGPFEVWAAGVAPRGNRP